MGTLGRSTRNGKKAAQRRVERTEGAHPAIAKLAVTLKEHKEVLEQQAATAEILHALSRSPGDAQPVFRAIVDKAHRLCAAAYSVLYRYDGEWVSIVASKEMNATGMRVLHGNYPQRPRRDKLIGRAVLEGKIFHSADINNDARFPAATKALPRRAVIALPLVRDDKVLGIISCGRTEAKSFTKKEISLLKTFADQAVIAIENARLFNETKEALERQTATAEVLRVISQSQTDTQPVFEAIVRSAVRLCAGSFGSMLRIDGDTIRLGAYYHPSPEAHKLVASRFPAPLSEHSLVALAARTGTVMHSPDTANDPRAQRSAVPKALGVRAQLTVPLLRDGKVIAALNVARSTPGPFSEAQIEMLKTFADQAVIAIENVRLFNETKEALERQTATAEILRVIASSPNDVQPVFEAIVASAVRLCGARFGRVYRYDGTRIHMVASHGLSASGLGQVQAVFPRPASHDTIVGRVIASRRPYFVTDIKSEKDVPPLSRGMIEALGTRAQVTIPMLRSGEPIGAITMGWDAPGAFNNQQVTLLQTFADQAVIAVENVRLFNETKEALEQQTATSQVLSVISSSPTDVAPVYRTILDNVTRLCEANIAALFLYDGELIRTVAHHNATAAFGKQLDELRVPPSQETPTRRAALERRIVHVEDLLSDPSFSLSEAHRQEKPRTVLSVPLLREGALVGVITVWRREPRLFTDKQVALVKTFADQAVIAIENVRLFNETKESLERQTATAEILRVIASSPSDVQPVFDAIVSSAVRLIGGFSAVAVRVEGEMLHLAAITSTSSEGDDAIRRIFPQPVTAAMTGNVHRAVQTGMPAVRRDMETDLDVSPESRAAARARGWRSAVAVPMMREDKAVGAINVTRVEAGDFSSHEIDLLQTFAAQAVIAIENVRLFNETKESLEQQTAISEVLRVISNSPADVQPVLEAVAERAAKICDAVDAQIFLQEGDDMKHVARFGPIPIGVELGDARPLSRGWVAGRAVLEGRAIHIEDLLAVPREEYPVSHELRDRAGHRTLLSVPLMRERKALGAISLRRMDVRPFTEKQIALLRTFADQAAIAIENVRLFNETKEALERQTATSEILKVISRTIFDLQPVLEIVLSNARRLCEADRGVIFRPDAKGSYRPVAFAAPGDAINAATRDVFDAAPIEVDRSSATGRAIVDGVTIHIPDVRQDPLYERHDVANVGGYRSILAVPMLRAGTPIGVLTLSRTGEARPFTEKQIELVTVFADQAVIAIENVRLFNEIQEKSAQLEVANKHKSDFLANMSHELRTPLNAIIGFSEALMERMFGEVNDKQAEYLKDIHESGRHLLSLINDILDLSKIEAGRMELDLGTFHLPTALSNAMTLVRERAQRHAIELRLDVDERLGEFQADERKFKQIMLNLLSNAVKFTPDGGRVDVCAKKDTDKIEIAVKDTGIGIALEDQAVVFEEFRQVGRDQMRKAEGTGLGLALTKRFVELHGGAIRLESTPGKGSTFTVSLPLR